MPRATALLTSTDASFRKIQILPGGYSIGHWEGDTLVVESAGLNDRTWLDRVGHPHSEEMRVAERVRRMDFGHMQFQVIFDDPQTLIRPLTISLKVSYAARYAGTYEFREGVPERSSRERKTVSLVNGQNAQPLIRQSETTFENGNRRDRVYD
jgi:hypothetical protein